MRGVNPLADAVRNERLERHWSIRRAVAESGNLITNTWWGKFEDHTQPLTDSIRQAVAAAYGWTEDWPDVALARTPSLDNVVSRLAAVEEVIREGVPAGELQDKEIQELRRRLKQLEAEVRALKRQRPPRAAGE